MNAPTNVKMGARLIGERVLRKEDGRLLTGRGAFTDDIVLPGMLHAAFARSPIAHGRILSVDTSVAREMPGVRGVFTVDDLDRFKLEMVSFYLVSPAPGTKVHPLAKDKVKFVGDPVVMIVAENRYQAEDAVSVVEIEYEELEPVVTIADARTAPPIHDDQDSNIAAESDLPLDDEIEEIFRTAACVVEDTITHQRISQSPMETRGVVASRNGEDELTVYIACQSPQMVARQLSMALGLPSSAIRVIAKDVGGSFGLKVQSWREEMAAVLATMALGRPVKWTQDRWEALTACSSAREQECYMKIAFDADGRLLAAQSDYAQNNGAYPMQGPDQNIAVMMFMWAAYKLPKMAFVAQGMQTNTAGLGAFRGPWAMETLARETMLDIAARKLGISPLDIRRRNLVTKADQPTASVLGIPLEDITPLECLDQLLTRVDVAAFRKEQEEARKQGRYLGLGFATYIEPTASGGFAPLVSDVANIRIEPTGKVTAILSTHSQGHGTQTTMAQVIAEKVGVPYEDVSVYEDDSSRGGYGAGAAGSRQAVSGGGSSIKASEILVDKVKRLAAHLLNANPDDVTIRDGIVHVAGAEEMTRSLREIAEVAYNEPDRLPEGELPGLEAQYRYKMPQMVMTSAAHACFVEVDGETGFVKILRWVCSEDCGEMINPSIVEGQVAGGVAQAIGTVLLEDLSYDARGNPTAATYKDYLLPTISDVPDFEYTHICTPSKTVGGFRGIGEGGAIIGPPTLVNAIYDALAPFDARCLDLPLTPNKILDLMEGRDISRGAKPAHGGEAEAEIEQPIPAAAQAAPPMGGIPEAPPAPVAAPSVDGQWKMVIHSPVGAQHMTATFVTEGETLTGTLDSDQGAMDFAGTVSGSNLKWDLKVTKPMSVTLKYDLQVNGDTIAGKVKMGFFGTSKVTAERIS